MKKSWDFYLWWPRNAATSFSSLVQEIEAWWHQGITWSNAHLKLKKHHRTMKFYLKFAIKKMGLKMLTQNVSNFVQAVTHWGRVTHICVCKLTIIGSDNGLSPGWCQAIIWTNAWILLIGPLGTNFSEISIKIHIFSFMKMHLKMSSGNWQPSCLGLNVLMWW